MRTILTIRLSRSRSNPSYSFPTLNSRSKLPPIRNQNLIFNPRFRSTSLNLFISRSISSRSSRSAKQSNFSIQRQSITLKLRLTTIILSILSSHSRQQIHSHSNTQTSTRHALSFTIKKILSTLQIILNRLIMVTQMSYSRSSCEAWFTR